MNKDMAIKALVAFISDNYMVDEDEIPLDQSLIDEGIIDSFGLIEIASYLQEAHGIVIAEDELVRENFGSVIKMIDFAARKHLAASAG